MENPIQTDFLRWIVFLPLIGAVINGLAGFRIQRALGKGAIGVIACMPVIVSFILSVYAFMTLSALPPEQRFLLDYLYTWVELGSLKSDIAFMVDPLTAVMILVVTGIGGLIHIYATGYMHEDNAFWRFFAYLNLFTAAMLTLVMGDNLLLMFVGWEGVGLCSYALIGFWYQDHANARAGNKAFIVNRVGDFGFLLGIFLLFWSLDAQGHGTIIFREMAQWASSLEGQTIWGVSVVTLATLFMFIGATGKSAQIPLYVWLPDAMAGPTPVSALIHAATMVTAGVYMTARLNFFFSMAPETLHVIAWIGVLTALLAATIALTQTDIKRVLAYSTVSQLGYMFIGVGVGGYAAAVFHLMTHAFFKACLFLGAGSVIHAMHHEQDMRYMGGLRRFMPLTFVTFFISVLAIAGTPGTAGFFSKDEILWLAFSSEHGSSAIWFLGVCGAGMTAFYMFRQLFLVFFGEFRGAHHGEAHHAADTTHHAADTHAGIAHGSAAPGAAHPHESPRVMTWPLVVLAIGALLVGWIGLPAVFGGSQFAHWLEPVVGAHAEEHPNHALELGLMAVSTGVALLGFLLAFLIYYRHAISPALFAGLAGGFFYRLFNNKWYVDEIYQAVFVNGALRLARIGSLFDEYVVDGIVNGSATFTRVISRINGLFDTYIVDATVNAVANITFWTGNRFRRVQTGNINSYLYGILIAVVVAILVKIRYSS